MTIRINTNNTHNAPNSKNEIIEEIKGTEVQKETEEVYFTDNIETQETETAENENLAKTYITPSEVLEAWENSPSHNANLLDKDFKGCAISKITGGDGITYISIEFNY